jgi:alkaline phosphatase D
MDHPLHFPGFKHLADWIPKLKAHFMLFLGDFIYIDVPHRFGYDAETYRGEYRRVYSSPDWPSVSDDLPWIHVLDDHEIANDWDKNTTGVYSAAADPFQHYHVAANPPPARAGHTWFTFTQGPASFFLMDTRRYRTPENKDPMDAEKSMLGNDQLKDLLRFLYAPLPNGVKWKFIISSIPFTKNWHYGGEDTWGGYLVERKIILEAMWEAGAKGIGVVVLSGDRHEFAATAFPPPKESRFPASATVYEFSTSPLSMFYLPVRTYKQVDDEDVTIKYAPSPSYLSFVCLG